MLKEAVLIAASSPAVVGGAAGHPTNLPPLSSLQEDALQNLKELLPYVCDSVQLKGNTVVNI